MNKTLKQSCLSEFCGFSRRPCSGISLFSDLTHSHWTLESRRFEGTWCPNLQGSTCPIWGHCNASKSRSPILSTGTALYAGTTDFSVVCKFVALRGLIYIYIYIYIYHRHVTKYGNEGGNSYVRFVNLAANNTDVYKASHHDPPTRKTSVYRNG
jgi:hypothetical protein